MFQHHLCPIGPAGPCCPPCASARLIHTVGARRSLSHRPMAPCRSERPVRHTVGTISERPVLVTGGRVPPPQLAAVAGGASSRSRGAQFSGGVWPLAAAPGLEQSAARALAVAAPQVAAAHAVGAAVVRPAVAGAAAPDARTPADRRRVSGAPCGGRGRCCHLAARWIVMVVHLADRCQRVTATALATSILTFV